MKAKTPNSGSFSLKRSNIVEVEFYCLDSSRAKRKIAIPHGQFTPPVVLHNHQTNQWFMWCSTLGIYQEMTGAVLSSIEVIDNAAR